MILLKMTIFFGVALLVVVEDQKMDMEDDGGFQDFLDRQGITTVTMLLKMKQ